jgi:malate dehydrogenase (oxaloacetate-decarboxylating)
MDYATQALNEHEKHHGTIGTESRVHLTSRDDLATYYTPGIGAVAKAIAENPADSWRYTNRGNSVAVISDGSAVLGYGSLGPDAALPVMTGKALLFKELAGIDAIPLVLQTENADEIIATVRALAPSFGGINLEDIAAPYCFAIENALQDLGIPVMHDDQHGTAVVVAAALQNAFRVVGKTLTGSTIVVNGAGAAGTAIVEMLRSVTEDDIDIIVLDSKGIISKDRHDLTPEKVALANHTNKRNLSGMLDIAAVNADCLIGVSKAGSFTEEHIKSMAAGAIVFALANPVPEIFPDEAKNAGAAVVATGRSDFPNQVNNSLAFPGIFRGALDAGAYRITADMLKAATNALATLVPEPNAEHILPEPLDPIVAKTVGMAVAEVAIATHNSRNI